jgi:predicted nucleotidyltransferase
MDFNLRDRTILLVVAGSRAYGIHTSASDVDVKGIAIPPAFYFHGCALKFEQADGVEHIRTFVPDLNLDEQTIVAGTKLEGTVYEIRKILSLCAEANPNCLDLLFCRDEEVRLITPLGRKLREHRHLFLSAKARFSFAGYAHAQLKRIRGHRAYLLNPPDHQPTRAEFGLPEHTLLPADQLAAAEAAVRKRVDQWEFDFSGLPEALIVQVENQIAGHLAEMRVALGFETKEDMKWLAAARLVGLDDNLIYVMQKEREYNAAHVRWKQYQDWKTNRNEARAALEAKSLFDTKHGAHLVRLLKMCREILEQGEVNVWRGGRDAEELLAIRNGAWTYEQVVEWAEREDAELDAIYKTNKYVVPKQPDRHAINNLCIDLVETALSEGVLR